MFSSTVHIALGACFVCFLAGGLFIGMPLYWRGFADAQRRTLDSARKMRANTFGRVL